MFVSRDCEIGRNVSCEELTVGANLLCMLPIAMARSSFGGVIQSLGKGQFLGFCSPLTA